MKVGDKVRSRVESVDITTHDIYELIEVGEVTVSFKDNDGILRKRSVYSVELVEENECPFNEVDKIFCKENPCQYCNLTKRELKMVQSELNDAYVMLQNRDNKIKELERKLKYRRKLND